jgi:hypothetical protein
MLPFPAFEESVSKPGYHDLVLLTPKALNNSAQGNTLGKTQPPVPTLKGLNRFAEEFDYLTPSG